MSVEYLAIGKFPHSERILKIGPKKETHTKLTIQNIGTIEEPQWTGSLAVNNKDINGAILFERNEEDNTFKTPFELKDWLIEKFSIIYLRDLSKPAISTGE